MVKCRNASKQLNIDQLINEYLIVPQQQNLRLQVKLFNQFINQFINIHSENPNISASKMEQQAQTRANRMNSIRASLKLNPVLTKNTDKVQKAIEKKKIKQEQQGNETLKQQKQQQTPFVPQSFPNMSAFDERYQILQKIGQGSNGIVYKCRNIKEDKIYAVKSMNIDEEHILYLKKNFVTVRNLKHRNIISYKALYIDRSKNLCNLVMEYVNYPNLLEAKVNADEFKQMTFEILEAIKFLHQKLICHRDIKPENILRDPDTKQIKIIDFGISKKLIRRHAKQSMLTFTGTLFYKAPEMFLGGGYDQRVDLWALGITLYKLVTGETPFESEYHGQTIENILNQQLKFQSEKWEEHHKFLADLINRLLKKDVEKRLKSTDALKHFYFTVGSQVFLPPACLTQSLSGDYSMQLRGSNLGIRNSSQGYNQISPLPRFNTGFLNETQETIEKWLGGLQGDLIESDSQEVDSALWSARQKNRMKQLQKEVINSRSKEKSQDKQNPENSGKRSNQTSSPEKQEWKAA